MRAAVRALPFYRRRSRAHSLTRLFKPLSHLVYIYVYLDLRIYTRHEFTAPALRSRRRAFTYVCVCVCLQPDGQVPAKKRVHVKDRLASRANLLLLHTYFFVLIRPSIEKNLRSIEQEQIDRNAVIYIYTYGTVYRTDCSSQSIPNSRTAATTTTYTRVYSKSSLYASTFLVYARQTLIM